jgi:hypothetical protein
MRVGDIIQFKVWSLEPKKIATIIEVHTYEVGVVDDDRIWKTTLLYVDGSLQDQYVSELEFEVINESR